MKQKDDDYESFFNIDEDGNCNDWCEDEKINYQNILSMNESKPITQDSWAFPDDDYDECGDIYDFDIDEEETVTPENIRLSKQLMTQLKIESLDDEFNDKDRIKLVKKKLNAHIIANPNDDIIEIAARMISYRDKKIHKSEENNDNN
jgi:hypothetical protein